jgi:serine/threonine protein kinase
VSQELQPGDPLVIGPYRLVRRLGGGGMGRVFLGQSPSGRLFAVKVIHPDMAADSVFRVRFRREVAAARKVSGAFTAGVVDADATGEIPWLAMEYVAGESLEEAVARDGPFAPSRLRVLGAQLAEGLCAIHAAGLVHRDLKPANVLLAADGPRIIDFGVARMPLAATVTGPGAMVGTPGYLSPEQAISGEASPASDIFGLGAVLAFAATGRPPFGTGTAEVRIVRTVSADPDLDGVPQESRPLIERCLAKEPGARPVAADILAEFVGSDRGGGDLVVKRPLDLAPVAVLGTQAGVLTSTYPVPAIPVTADPVTADPVPVAESAPGAPVLNITVKASDNARVIVAGGDVHVDG